MTWSIQFLQAEEAQGTARACKESLVHEPDTLRCPQAGGDEGGHKKQVLVLGRALGCTPSRRGGVQRSSTHGTWQPVLLPGGFAGLRMGITVGGTQQKEQSGDFPPAEWKKYKKVEGS